MMALIDRMKLRLLPTVESNEALLAELILSAGEDVMLYTNRTTVPASLEGIQVDLAVIRYNQRGIEGESSHSEGEVGRSISSLPQEKQFLLNNMRLARTVF
jgi:hypothetical protein